MKKNPVSRILEEWPPSRGRTGYTQIVEETGTVKLVPPTEFEPLTGQWTMGFGSGENPQFYARIPNLGNTAKRVNGGIQEWFHNVYSKRQCLFVRSETRKQRSLFLCRRSRQLHALVLKLSTPSACLIRLLRRRLRSHQLSSRNCCP